MFQVGGHFVLLSRVHAVVGKEDHGTQLSTFLFSQLGVSISHQNDGQNVLHVGIVFTSVNDDRGVR